MLVVEVDITSQVDPGRTERNKYMKSTGRTACVKSEKRLSVCLGKRLSVFDLTCDSSNRPSVTSWQILQAFNVIVLKRGG